MPLHAELAEAPWSAISTVAAPQQRNEGSRRQGYGGWGSTWAVREGRVGARALGRGFQGAPRREG
jgi:hypothetical protein